MRKVTVGVIGHGIAGKLFHAPLLDVLEEFVWRLRNAAR
jgi:hypothetical protein